MKPLGHTLYSNKLQTGKIYVLGLGSVGLPLAAFLAAEGRNVVAVRTSQKAAPAERIMISVRLGENAVLSVPMETVGLAELKEFDGVVVVAAKSYANPALASELMKKTLNGPLVIMQNGIGVEAPFLEAGFDCVCRCVLYITSQRDSANSVTFRQIASSPIGVVRGEASELKQCAAGLTTGRCQFHLVEDIRRDVWKKAIVNAVFNSICPLLDADNGVFARDSEAIELAREIVGECVVLAGAMGMPLTESEVMSQIMKISEGSQGVLISTLQDIRNGRKTEIESLNLAMSRLAASTSPPIHLGKTALLGRMILAKSRLRMAEKDNPTQMPLSL